MTALGVDRPYYRGIDVLGLAATVSFETVAEWLWTGDPAVWRPPADVTSEDDGGVARRAGRAAGPGAKVSGKPDGGPGAKMSGKPSGGPGASTGGGPGASTGGGPGASTGGGPGASTRREPGKGPGDGPGAVRRGGQPWWCEPEEGLRAAVTAQRGLPDDLLPSTGSR
ncbi:hypothetical protein ACFQ0B_30675 [Nonomuraea thailandensis]